MDLGLAVLSVLAVEGTPLSLHDIAAWAGCSQGNIYRVERRALRKLRKKLRRELGMTWEEFLGGQVL
jgi:DNA-directed RNA polymerase specialized sigma24 family protein